jgi:hypothetical protein
VRPGVLLVFANFLFFVKVLSAVDFPAFDLPANATSIPSSGGHFDNEGALDKKVAVWKLMIVILALF